MIDLTNEVLAILKIERNCNYNDRTINKREKQQVRKICEKINTVNNIDTEEIIYFLED